jgi:DNA invertase Pin-like site-specific DNA recombinase
MTAQELSLAPDAPRIKVIGLVRVSTPGQATDDHAGFARQHAAIARTAAVHNLEVVKTIELVISGTLSKGHAEVLWMRRMIESGQVGGVVAADIDRIMRPEGFADYELYDSFISVKAKIYTEAQVYDCGSDMGQFTLMVKSFFSGMDRRGILKRVNDSRRILQEQGAHVWGEHQLPMGIGYERKSQVYSLKPEIVKVQEAFRLIDEEGIHNIREISRRLGIHDRRLHRMLRNPLYAGYRVYEFTRASQPVVSKKGKPYHAKLPLPDDKKIKVKVMDAPAISEDRWKRVQSILEQKGMSWQVERDIHPLGNILGGLTYCGACGHRLYHSADRRRPLTMGYYFCSQKHYKTRSKRSGCGARNQGQATLNDVTFRFVTEHLTKASTVKAIFEHARATKEATIKEPLPDPQQSAESGSMDWEERSRRLDTLFEMGRLTRTQLAERIAQVEREKAAFEARQKAKATTQQVSQEKKVIDNIAIRLKRGGLAFIRVTNPNWRHNALKGMFKEIHYSGGQITAFKLREDIFPENVCESGLQSGLGSSRRRA